MVTHIIVTRGSFIKIKYGLAWVISSITTTITWALKLFHNSLLIILLNLYAPFSLTIICVILVAYMAMLCGTFLHSDYHLSAHYLNSHLQWSLHIQKVYFTNMLVYYIANRYAANKYSDMKQTNILVIHLCSFKWTKLTDESVFKLWLLTHKCRLKGQIPGYFTEQITYHFQ